MLDPADRLLFRRIWALTWPMIIYNALELAVGLVELVLVRPFGPAATAAIGVSRQITFLVEALALAITAGTLALVSQGVGAARAPDHSPQGADAPHSPANVGAIVRHGLLLVLLLGVPTSAAGYWLSGPLLATLQAGEATLMLGTPYLRVYFAGLVFLWVNLVSAAVFRGLGNVWTPLKLALGVSLLQVILSYMLIHGTGPLPALAVPGAAVGAVAARACGAVAFLILLRGHMPPVRHGLDLELIRRLLRIGVPMALANVLRHGSRVVFMAIAGASAIGVSLHAALGVGLQLRLLSILPALAFQTATATLVGQALGRGDPREAESLGRRSVQLLAILLVLVAGLVLAFADPLAALFLDSPEASVLAARVLRWFAIAQVFSALSIGTQGALLGAGDTLPAMRYTFLSEWCLMLPLSYLLLVLDWVPDGLLAAWTLAPLLTLILMQRRFRSGKWLSVTENGI